MKIPGAAGRSAAERGSAALPFALALPVIIGVMGLAIDLAYVYSRQTELQQLADRVALAAARSLDGTHAGVITAEDEAYIAALGAKYDFRKIIKWNSSALKFAASPDAAEGDWKDFASITSDDAAAGLAFVRVDTASLSGTKGGQVGAIATFFMHELGSDGLSVNARSVAGPTSVRVTPLAVCALDTNPAGSRTNAGLASDERIEYGFRRGVSYNLLDLNPNATTAGAYLVNPIDAGTEPSKPAHYAADVVKPFFCSGTLGLPDVAQGARIHVTALGDLQIHPWLNSRFNEPSSVTGCKDATAPSDTNIREYVGGYTDWYMAATPSPYPSSAASTDKNGAQRVTFADLRATDTTSATPTPESFGPLWTYSRPVTVTGTQFQLADWPKLYQYKGVSVPAGSTKYGTGNGVYLEKKHSVKPTGAGPTPNYRRVLNIPLLDCSVATPGTPGVPATVLGIGKFFMTARATAGATPSVPGEFAGMFRRGVPANTVGLYK